MPNMENMMSMMQNNNGGEMPNMENMMSMMQNNNDGNAKYGKYDVNDAE